MCLMIDKRAAGVPSRRLGVHREVHYPVSELAARYGASVAEETSDWRQAYATVERFRRERPPNWARLPWA